MDTPATPALVIDSATVERNIKRLAVYADEQDLDVRPHTKTHKSRELAAAQLAAGALGLTVAKVGEAEVMSEVGSDLLVAYPAIDPARTERLAKLARHFTIRVAVDSVEAAEALAAAARRTSSTIGILVDIDVGSTAPACKPPPLRSNWPSSSIASPDCGSTASVLSRPHLVSAGPAAAGPGAGLGRPGRDCWTCGPSTDWKPGPFPAARPPRPTNRTWSRNTPRSGPGRTSSTT